MSKTIFETPEAFTFEQYRPFQKATIRRNHEGAGYVVTVHEGGRVTGREVVATHVEAWKVAKLVRGGVSL